MKLIFSLNLLIMFCASLFLNSGCAYDPISGRNQLSMVSTEEEIAVGKEADPYIKKQYGVYKDANLQTFVSQVGQKVAIESDREGITYSFTVLDSSIINAFALPGGFLYITRGALAQMNTESELAYVLGHEITHVAAKHGAEQMSQQKSVSFLNQVAKILTQQNDLGVAGDVVNTGINLAVLGYGRDHEFEADKIGIKYMYEAGYDPEKGSRFLHTLKRQEKYVPNGLVSFLSSHPPTSERIERANEISKNLLAEFAAPTRNLIVGKKTFLKKIESIYMGPDGSGAKLTKDGEFQSGWYGIKFSPPEGWALDIPHTGPILEMVSKKRGSIAKGKLYARKIKKKMNLDQFIAEEENRLFIDGNFTVKSTKSSDQDAFYKRVQKVYRGDIVKVGTGQVHVVYLLDATYGYTLLFAQNIIDKINYKKAIDAALDSFGFLSKAQKKKLKAYRLKLHEIKQDESFETLSQTYFDNKKEMGRISAFNDMSPSENLIVGDLIKIPVHFELDPL